MSKTVSGQDVEDMLSSVRRLVSNELPPHRRMSRTPDAEKLVLTESQRVEPPKRVERPRSQRLEDRIAELEAAVSKTQDDWEPDGSEDQAQNQPDRIVYTPPSPRRTTRRISRITLLESERSASDPSEGESARDLSPAELEAVAREAMSKERPSFDAALDQAVSKSVEQEVTSKDENVAVTSKVEPEPEPKPSAKQSLGQPLQLTPEELAPEEKGATNSSEAPTSPQTVDAETLRPIVNKLLRDELQGEIGERITRNVRKLVRQEIQRALAMDDLD